MQNLWQSLHAADVSLLFHINTMWISPWLDKLMLFVSTFRHFLWPVVAAAVALFFFGGRRGRVFLVLMLLAVAIGDGVIDNFGKKIVHRARPSEGLVDVRVVEASGVHASWPAVRPAGRSFPSGHVFNNVSLALIACAVYGTRRYWWLWFWVALVGYSRIYLGSHYPSDVLGTVILSVLFNLGLLAVARAAWRRWRPAGSDQELY